MPVPVVVHADARIVVICHEGQCLQLACDLSMCCARSVFEFDLIDRIRSWTWCRSGRRLGHMSTKICSTCREYLLYEDYHPREWKKREKRTCTPCRNKDQPTTAAPGIPNTHTRTHTHARFLSLFLAGRPPERERERERERRERREREREREKEQRYHTMPPPCTLSLS